MLLDLESDVKDTATLLVVLLAVGPHQLEVPDEGFASGYYCSILAPPSARKQPGPLPCDGGCPTTRGVPYTNYNTNPSVHVQTTCGASRRRWTRTWLGKTGAKHSKKKEGS